MDTNTARHGVDRKKPGRRGGARARAARVCASALAAVALACGSGEAPAPAEPAPAPETIPDERPRGIVSLTPIGSRDGAEIGAAHLLVAVDAVSRTLPGLAHLPEARLDDASSFDPDWVLVPELPGEDDPADGPRPGARVEWIEFAPHDLEDVFALCDIVCGRIEREVERRRALIGG